MSGINRPAAVSVRLIGPPEALDAALVTLAISYGGAWQPGTRKASRHSGGEVLQYGTLIVPMTPGRDSPKPGDHDAESTVTTRSHKHQRLSAPIARNALTALNTQTNFLLEQL